MFMTWMKKQGNLIISGMLAHESVADGYDIHRPLGISDCVIIDLFSLADRPTFLISLDGI